MQPNVNVKGQWPRGATDGPRTPRALLLNGPGNWRTRKTRQRNRSTLAKQGQVTWWLARSSTATRSSATATPNRKLEPPCSPPLHVHTNRQTAPSGGAVVTKRPTLKVSWTICIDLYVLKSLKPKSFNICLCSQGPSAWP